MSFGAAVWREGGEGELLYVGQVVCFGGDVDALGEGGVVVGCSGIL